MIIDFQRSGGFTGIGGPAVHVDTSKLPPPEAKRVAELVGKLNLGERPAEPSPPSGGDRFQYTIRIEDSGHTHVVHAADGAISEELEPLLEYLMEFGRRHASAKKSQ